MKKMFFAVLVFCAIGTRGWAVGTPATGKTTVPGSPTAAVQRLVANLTPGEFAELTGQRMGLFQRMGYHKMRKRLARQLAAQGLRHDYDTLYLAGGAMEVGFLLRQANGHVVYKKVGQPGLQTVPAGQVYRLALSQTGRADTTKTTKPPFEKDATTAMWMGLGAIGSLFVPFASVFGLIALGILGVIFGIRALKKIKKSEGKLRGKGRAWVGIIVGTAVVALILAALVIFTQGNR
jgi:hypothetical protein